MMNKKIMLPPPHGWMTQLAKQIGCSRMTVYLAMRRGAKGEKCDKVRKLFQELYGDSKKQ